MVIVVGCCENWECELRSWGWWLGVAVLYRCFRTGGEIEYDSGDVL